MGDNNKYDKNNAYNNKCAVHYYIIYNKEVLVGATGFEPATPATPWQCATGLRHAPSYSLMMRIISSNSFFIVSSCLSNNGVSENFLLPSIDLAPSIVNFLL